MRGTRWLSTDGAELVPPAVLSTAATDREIFLLALYFSPFYGR
jgi:hypothetical protein